MMGASILIAWVVICFAAIILWALLIQPRSERARAEIASCDWWKFSGLEQIVSKDFALYQIVPADNVTVAEYHIMDDSDRELGRYTGTGRKSALLQYSRKTANLYIQGAAIGGSTYAGRVGGKSNNSVVIRDDRHVIAEAWRTRVFPATRYKVKCSEDIIQMAFGGIWPTSPGTITRNGEQIAAFRRPNISSRNLFIAFRPQLSDELKVLLCAISLLQ